MQIYHGGCEAAPAVARFGRAVALSTVEFDFLPYVPKGMTEQEILGAVTAFGAATRRVIEAGFDGVEIHGANHYLLQRFFSAYSNRRDDAWGGDAERRMTFPLAVVAEVLRVARAADREFVVGFRLCPDEIHGPNVGYTIDEARALADRVVTAGVDYVHISVFTGYDAAPSDGAPSYGQQIREAVDGRCPVVIVSDVFSADDAVRALEHGDAVAIGRAALLEPEFGAKGRFTDLDLPAGLREWYTTPGREVLPPLPGVEDYLV